MKKKALNIILVIILITGILVMGCIGTASPSEETIEVIIERILAETEEPIDPDIPIVIPEPPVVVEVEAEPQPLLSNELVFPRTGVWRVTGRGQQGTWTANLVISELSDNNFEGHFAWRGGLDGRSGGTEYFRGEYDTQTRRVSLQGYRLSNARGIGLDNYAAFLAGDGKNFVSGTWSKGGGRWEAAWEEEQQ